MQMENYNNGGSSFDIYQLLTVLLPIVSSVVTWYVARKKRNNDFLADLQRSIDLLSGKYNEALEELVAVKEQNSKLLIAQQEMKFQIAELKRENGVLKGTIDELNKRLEGVKTITRKA